MFVTVEVIVLLVAVDAVGVSVDIVLDVMVDLEQEVNMRGIVMTQLKIKNNILFFIFWFLLFCFSL